MAISEVQSVAVEYGTGSATISSPTEGNLLVVMASARSAPVTATLSGYTSIFQYDAPAGDTGDTTYRRQLAVFAKLAGASESTTVDPQFSTNSRCVVVAEFSAGAETWAAVTSNVNASNGNGKTADATTVSTGQTSSTSNELGIIFGAFKDNSASGVLTLSATGYTAVTNIADGLGSFQQSGGMLWQEFSDTAQRGSTGNNLTFAASTTTNNGLVAGIAVFGFASTGTTIEIPTGPWR